jgi:hypothetical protein
MFLASPNLQRELRVCPPSHPLRLGRWDTVRTIVVRTQLTMQTSQAMMSRVHRAAALDGVAKPVAVSAGEEPARAIKFCDLPAAVDPIGSNIADEPGALSAEPACRPSDRHTLLYRIPIATS